MQKNRQNFIIDLISKYEIETQEELVLLLNQNGFNVTQATISRDIKNLGLKKKVNGNRRNVYIADHILEQNENLRFKKLFKESVLSIRVANNIIVVKTISGSANSAAAMIDKLSYEQILGTVAGDDTIIMVVESNSDAIMISEKLKELLYTTYA